VETIEPPASREAVRESRYQALVECFSPDAPIDEEGLFQGRDGQRTALLSAIHQPGAHAVVFGERGAGKTSLARIVKGQLSSEAGALIVEAGCESGDSFATIWRQVFSNLKSVRVRPGRGFAADKPRRVETALVESLPDVPTAADICSGVEKTTQPVVVFLDEFDVLREQESVRFAGLIKMASDQRLQLTIVLLGVAENIRSLLSSHESVERCLHQIQMPRMSPEETRAIIELGWRNAGFDHEVAALDLLSPMAMGLPYYAHLLGQAAGFVAADRDQQLITPAIARDSLRRAAEKVQFTLATSYREACDCAGAATITSLASITPDQFGYVDATGVSDVSPLDRLCDGRVLTRDPGTSRYRFRNPLLQPYALMQRDMSDG
jgi:Cdc6-like AAA superfamily ATPase